jgi:6,7-dimethyl-8-ribityllumazine synthase
MASQGNTILREGIPTPKDAFIVIVKTEWNASIVNELEAGCIRILEAAGAGYKTLVVPGAVEIPFAIKAYSKINSPATAAYIALGAVIKGDTPHFDYVCKSVTDGITVLNTTLDVPVIFGVLTVNTEEQAKERIGGIHGHKGEEAAISALKMIEFSRLINHP